MEALERLEHCRYTLLLLDLMMPRVSGYEVLERLEHKPQDVRPLVIVLTAGTEARYFEPQLVSGTIRKPFDIELLVDAITGCIATLPDFAEDEKCPGTEDGALGSLDEAN